MQTIGSRLAEVRDRIAAAALRARRDLASIRLIAVSKTFSIDEIRQAYDAGQRDFGENRVQELQEKAGTASDLDIQWHLIGHLQSNKAKKAVADANLIHSIDSVALLQRVEAAADAAGKTVRLLVQTDLAAETTKHGAPTDQLAELFAAAQRCRAARVIGLMLLPPLADNPEQARDWFRQLRSQRDRLLEQGVPSSLLAELSMGMSHDFEVAIEEGATMVRVGSAIFGRR